MGVLGIVDTAGAQTGGISGRYEVKRSHQWTMEFDLSNVTNLKGDKITNAKNLQVQLQKSARPSFDVKELTVYRANEKYFLATRPDHEDLSVTFYDAMPSPQAASSDEGEARVSSGQIMYLWYASIYDPVTGAMALSKNYKAQATVTLYSPAGDVIERWLYVGMWPTKVVYGDLDYTADPDSLTATVTFKWDKCYKIGTDTSSNNKPPAAGTLPTEGAPAS